jgi:selenocysteine lyase/cysteine desulfurase
MTGILKLAYSIWRSGFIFIAVILDLLLLAVLACDLMRLAYLGVCPLLPFELSLTYPNAASAAVPALCLFVIALVVIPLAIGLARLTPALPNLPAVAMGSGRGVVIAHIAGCVAVAAAVLIAYSSKDLVGHELIDGRTAQVFYSWYGLLAKSSVYIVQWGLRAVAFSALGVIVSSAVVPPREGQPLIDYFRAAAELSDLPTTYVPIHRSHELDFTAPVLAPQIKLIAEVSNSVASEYDRLRPGSIEANEYLRARSEECKGLISSLILPVESARSYSVTLTSSTGRAIELALAHTPSDAVIVVSPFEHPNTCRVVSWYGRTAQASSHQLTFLPGELFVPWDDQERLIVEAMRERVVSHERVVLIVSEVCYSTGRIVPIDRLAAKIRSTWPDKELIVIVDGTHSVGNVGYTRDGEANEGRPRFLAQAQFYVFAAHKWLMAPEPCSVLLCRSDIPEIDGYDAWGRSQPSATPSPRMIAGLRGALELISQIGLRGLGRRSQLLQKRFLEHLAEMHLQEVQPQDATGLGPQRTGISVLKPTDNYAWRIDYRRKLSANSVSVFYPEEWTATGWLSLAFPYYLSIWHVDRLRSALRDSVSLP